MTNNTWRQLAKCRNKPAYQYETRNLPTAPTLRAEAAERACQGCPSQRGCGLAALENTPIGMVMCGIAFPDHPANVTNARNRVALKLGIPMPTARTKQEAAA